MGKNKYLASIDQPVARDYPVAGELLLFETKIGRAVNHEFIKLLETAIVEEEIDPFASSHLARRTLLFDTGRTAAFFGNA